MRTLPILRTLIAAALLALCVLISPQVFGQGGVLTPGGNTNTNAERLADVSAAPQPRPSKPYATWVGYLAIALMVGAIMGISLIPSKRSHQD